MSLEQSSVGFLGDQIETLGRVVMAEVVKITGHRKPGFVRDRPFATNVEPTVAGIQAMLPSGDHLAGNVFGSPQLQHRLQA